MKSFYEMLQILEEDYDYDANRGAWKWMDSVAKEKLANSDFLDVHIHLECIEPIKKFPNKKLLNEMLDFCEKVLNRPTEIYGKEKELVSYLTDQIDKAYKQHLVTSFDCVKRSCLDVIHHADRDEKQPFEANEKVLSLPKKIVISFSKWASVGRTFDSMLNSLDKFEPEIFFADDNDFNDFYYTYEEIKYLTPILSSIMQAV